MKVKVGFQPGRTYEVEFNETEKVTLSSVIAELEKISGKSTVGFEATVGTETHNLDSDVEVADGDIIGVSKAVKGGL